MDNENTAIEKARKIAKRLDETVYILWDINDISYATESDLEDHFYNRPEPYLVLASVWNDGYLSILDSFKDITGNLKF